jgi:hypothetical protein
MLHVPYVISEEQRGMEMVIPGVFVRAELSCYLIVQVNVCFGAWTLSNNDVPVAAST